MKTIHQRIVLKLQSKIPAGAGGGGAKILEPFQRPDHDIPHMLAFGSDVGKTVRACLNYRGHHGCTRPPNVPPLKPWYSVAGTAEAAPMLETIRSAATGHLQNTHPGPLRHSRKAAPAGVQRG